ADSNNKICAITGAMPTGTGLIYFQQKHPDKYFDVGIAEEHAALFACGLATQGFKPFLAIYSTFMQRAYDMIIHDMALQNLNVALCMDRGGLSGDDGPTHHGLFDIGYLRHVPNMVPMQPEDEEEFADLLWTMAIEDHVLHNGFGCAIIEHLNDAQIKTPVVRIGWPDQFVEHGAVDILRKKHGLTAEAAVEKMLPFVKSKSAPRPQPQTAA